MRVCLCACIVDSWVRVVMGAESCQLAITTTSICVCSDSSSSSSRHGALLPAVYSAAPRRSLLIALVPFARDAGWRLGRLLRRTCQALTLCENSSGLSAATLTVQ